MSASPRKKAPFKSPNKVVHSREETAYFTHHYRRIAEISKGFDDTAPPIHRFSYHDKHWREINTQSEKQGFENLHLLNRLQRVFDYDKSQENEPLKYRSTLQYAPGLKIDRYSYPRVDCVNLRTTPLESQNRGRSFSREVQMKSIVSDNVMLMNKLAATRSSYERGVLEKAFQKSRKYLDNARKVRSPSPTTQRLKTLHNQHFLSMSMRPVTQELGASGRISPKSTGRMRSGFSTPKEADWDPSTAVDRDAHMMPWYRPPLAGTALEAVGTLYKTTNVIEPPEASSPSGRGLKGRHLYGPESYEGYRYRSPGRETLQNDTERLAPVSPPKGSQDGSAAAQSPRRLFGTVVSPSQSKHHRVPILASSGSRNAGGIASLGASRGAPAPAKSRPDSRGGDGLSDTHQLSVAGDLDPEEALETYKAIAGEGSEYTASGAITPAPFNTTQSLHDVQGQNQDQNGGAPEASAGYEPQPSEHEEPARHSEPEQEPEPAPAAYEPEPGPEKEGENRSEEDGEEEASPAEPAADVEENAEASEEYAEEDFEDN